MMQGKVLVFGDDTRSFLATVRALGRHGIEVHAAPSRFISAALRSRHIRQVHRLPPWLGDGAAWLASLEALLRRERYDLVIPCTEIALLQLQAYRPVLAGLARLALPDDSAIAVLFDKHAVRECARSLGVPVADGGLPQPGETAAAILERYGAPLMIKPRRSFTLAAPEHRRTVQAVRDAATLAPLLPALPPEDYLFESFFPGRGLGVSVLAGQGRVLQAFEHHRVREDEAGSYYRVSAPLTPALLAACEAICGALSYTGLAMFEFRRDPANGAWVLLEVNARPWGSMPLPVGLGVDFPWFLYRLLVDGVAEPRRSYRAGVYARNLLLDLRGLTADAQRRHACGKAWVGPWLADLAELRRWPLGQELSDTLVADDPTPGLVELREEALARGRWVGRRLPGWAALARLAARRRAAAALRRAAGRPVLFVCQGNICRSPFAEHALRELWRTAPDAPPIGSYGVLPRTARPTPASGIAEAAAHAIDLTAHRSRYLTQEAAEGAALLVVFDERNRNGVRALYPGLATPLIKLGDLSDGQDIPDPFGAAQEKYAEVYRKILRGVRALAAVDAAR
jgi:protein-tyrosine-phosphatase/predicted ATP-grasp superfamily ATP-dependent carboligase